MYEYDEETKREILAAIDYRRDKTVQKAVRSFVPDEARRALDIAAIDGDWVTQNGFGNVLPDYETILAEGIGGAVRRAEKRIADPI